MDYILLTPIKDEIENLLTLKNTILNQKKKPLVWIIIDGSNDTSFEYASTLFSDCNWIHLIRQKNIFEKGYSHKNFAEAINEGYHYLREIDKKMGIEYQYIGKTDATPILSENYFECLIREMEINKDIMITCGLQIVKNQENMIPILPRNGLNLIGFNDIRLYRRYFFENIGGYPLTPSPDTVILIKAIRNNQQIRVIKDAYFIESRLGGSKIGIWDGFFLKGKMMFILGYHPILMLINALYSSIKFYPHYQGIAMFFGYTTNFFRGTEKIKDEEIKEYFGEKRLNEIVQYFIKKYIGSIETI